MSVFKKALEKISNNKKEIENITATINAVRKVVASKTILETLAGITETAVCLSTNFKSSDDVAEAIENYGYSVIYRRHTQKFFWELIESYILRFPKCPSKFPGYLEIDIPNYGFVYVKNLPKQENDILIEPTLPWIYYPSTKDIVELFTIAFLADMNIKTNYFNVIPAPAGNNSLGSNLVIIPEIVPQRETTHSLYKKCDQYLKDGLKRSFLLNGNPGSGKTTIAKTICANFNLRTMHLNYSALSTQESTVEIFSKYINIEAIIIDDIENLSDATRILEFMEKMNSKLKFVFYTSNNYSRMPKSFLRPGRIDEIYQIDCLEEEVYNTIVNKSDEYYEKLKYFPVAYINEFLKRRKYVENPEELFNELKKRSEISQDTSDHRKVVDIDAGWEEESEKILKKIRSR